MSNFGNLDYYLEVLTKCQILPERDMKFICDKAIEILINQPNMKLVRAPVTVCGDIHGQFYDLMEVFQIGGNLPDTNYLFLGDYVDRGYNSIETITYMLVQKIKRPDRLTLLRGNHENKEITKMYGFYQECLKKYGNQNVWKMFTELFNYFPLAATIENQIFSLHGGLSPKLTNISEIEKLNRKQQIPTNQAMTDLLWSDPDEQKLGFAPSVRGAGYIWGNDITDKFIHTNNLKMICRAHQLVMEGYQYAHKQKCVTIFSAPNYCYKCGNQASILEIDDQMGMYYHQYEPAPRQHQPQITRRIPAYFL